MNKNSKIYIAGHKGLVGSAIVKSFKEQGYTNLVLRTRDELDLLDKKSVFEFFNAEKPEYVINSAAKVGGISDSIAHPAEYLYENVELQNNITWAAKEAGVKRFLFIGSAVVYPNDSPQPMKEEYFMQGEPDPTKSGYAYAKINGLKLCEYINQEFGLAFNTCLPTNIYGPNDNFDPATSHVIPSLIRRMHEAKVNNLSEVSIWGKGDARREFLYVDDLAEAVIWLLGNYDSKEFVNVGTGKDVSMRELAESIKKIVGYEGELVFDATKPEGIPRRLFNVARLHDTGWHHKMLLEDGLNTTYQYFLKNIAT